MCICWHQIEILIIFFWLADSGRKIYLIQTNKQVIIFGILWCEIRDSIHKQTIHQLFGNFTEEFPSIDVFRYSKEMFQSKSAYKNTLEFLSKHFSGRVSYLPAKGLLGVEWVILRHYLFSILDMWLVSCHLSPAFYVY